MNPPIITIDGVPIKGILQADTYRFQKSKLFGDDVLIQLPILVDKETSKKLFKHLVECGDVNVHYECTNAKFDSGEDDDDEKDN